ncbi:hypothetical protein [Streptomyces albipurpureus]|uniref:CU044_5270 family protein n=1 Tax=Streptomyces albipurpureus TaxID=2897419 RepID=A0ABT0UJV2_9ACTN|nr:hypothetical protein [Streptomyces sp. CWNU-1]MCM2388385.1 hypothetical protein [Streptomyces sp. CWNU-1]
MDDDMTAVRRLRSDAPTPDRARLAPSHQRVLDGISAPRPQWWRGRAAAALGAAAVTVAAVLTAQLLSPGGGSTAGSADRVVSEPRDDQWIYRRTVIAQTNLTFAEGRDPTTEKGNGQVRTVSPLIVYEEWTNYSSGRQYHKEPGDKIRLSSDPAMFGSPKSLRSKVAGLPDDPVRLLKALRERIPSDETPSSGKQADFDYAGVLRALREVDHIPLKAHASIFRALQEIPGVAISRVPVKDLMGRPALVVYGPAMSEQTSQREGVLLDPTTFEFRGVRTVLPAGGSIDGRVTSEDTVTRSLAVVTAVVDRHGQVPGGTADGKEGSG